ncbi:GIY-YIG nuclease family protein [Pandoraea sp. XY-2]|uniref:GIY-YIG nuclease family protein n=1 Tax=Pandoraea sp. XY-2 TaxID=2518599 RepID=UPI0010210113|nr:GIY-YIG nuclease family protein [Pandoraea sp. XY-2]
MKGPIITATPNEGPLVFDPMLMADRDDVAPLPGKTTVYISTSEDGTTQYVGITDNFKSRYAAHLRQKEIEITPITGLRNISREDARAIEQVLIEFNGLGKDKGTLLNKINSIARKNPEYATSLARGASILKTIGYEGFE